MTSLGTLYVVICPLAVVSQGSALRVQFEMEVRVVEENFLVIVALALGLPQQERRCCMWLRVLRLKTKMKKR